MGYCDVHFQSCSSMRSAPLHKLDGLPWISKEEPSGLETIPSPVNPPLNQRIFQATIYVQLRARLVRHSHMLTQNPCEHVIRSAGQSRIYLSLNTTSGLQILLFCECSKARFCLCLCPCTLTLNNNAFHIAHL